MVWDRRARQRQHASPAYLDAVDSDSVPWGGALRLEHVMKTESGPAQSEGKTSLIRSLRFCRDQAGLLAVLSRTGQLKVLSTKHEYVETEFQQPGCPELLEVRRSFEIDHLHAETTRRSNRIVSFDWVTLNSPVFQPRLLVLRHSGAFDIVEKPSFTAEYPFKLIPWQPPHRGVEGKMLVSSFSQPS
jgi:WD repeat-containing protein mio